MQLSIIIPHRNRSEMLEKILLSIPQNKSLQIIIIDNYSDSSHLNVIAKLKNNYNFEFYHNDRINSAGLCRNIGLEKAKGKWILFADDDDYFLEGFYNKISKYFNSNNDVVFFSPTSKYLNTNKIANRHLPFQRMINNYIDQKDKKSELMLKYNFIPVWSKMINKFFLDKYNFKFEEAENTCGDIMFSTKIGFFLKNFDLSKENIYCINKWQGSTTSILDEDWFDMRVKTRINRIIFLKEHLSNEERIIMKNHLCLIAAQLLFLSLRKFGIKKFVNIYKLYLNKNIQWFSVMYLNPLKIIKYIFLKKS